MIYMQTYYKSSSVQFVPVFLKLNLQGNCNSIAECVLEVWLSVKVCMYTIMCTRSNFFNSFLYVWKKYIYPLFVFELTWTQNIDKSKALYHIDK